VENGEGYTVYRLSEAERWSKDSCYLLKIVLEELREMREALRELRQKVDSFERPAEQPDQRQKPKAERALTLEGLVSGITPENRHEVLG
jgi:hypothetical protein